MTDEKITFDVEIYARNVIKELKALATEFQKTQASSGGASGSTKDFKQSVDSATESVKKTGKAMNEAEPPAKKWAHGIDLIRTALGTLTAVAIFQFISFLSEALKKTIDGFRQLELAIYKVGVAERSLSQAGIEIAPEDLTKTIEEITTLFPFISKIDATKLVGDVALLTKDLKLSGEQLATLMKSIPALAVAGGVSVEQATQQVINGLTTSGRGWKDLGIVVDANIIKQRAISDELVRSEDAYNSLTAEQKQQVEVMALLNILGDKTNDVISTQGDYLKTLDATSRDAASAWEDFLATLGKLASPLLIDGLKLLIDQLERMNEWLIKNQEEVTILVSFLSGLVAAQRELNKFNEDKTLFDKIFGAISPGLAAIRNAGKASGADLGDAFMEGYEDAMKRAGEFGELTDTPTNLDTLQESFDSINTDEAQKEVEDLLQDLEKLLDKMAEEEADFQIKLTRFDEDGTTDRIRLIEDYNLNVAQTIRAFNARRAESEAKYRQKELEDEAKFQEQLRQLREKYLFNLEDALRERDARQVLRLGEQYRMDKQALINENDLRKEAAENNRRLEREQAQRDLQERLRVMAEEQALRLKRFDEEQALKRKRMEEDHALEMQRLKEGLDERIKQAADKIAEEYGVNADGALAIYELLKKYYGSGGAFSRLTNSGYKAMLSQANSFLTALTGIVSQYSAVISSVASIPIPTGASSFFSGGQVNTGGYVAPSSYVPTSNRYAKGGRFVATRPTKIEVGEGGEPEFVSITPLSKLGQQMPTVNGQINMEGSKSSIEVMVDLSPDLEARVVNRAANNTAQIVSRVRKSKR